jgi:NAD(P)-dependent dehydrogenase (short-subunit alcohol dehydrogenase family)
MSMNLLADKVAIVSGASSGIGHAAAKLFAENGAKVFVTARREPELISLAGEISDAGGTAHVVAGDVRDEHVHRALTEEALGRYGRLDVALNNAGGLGEMGPAESVSVNGWRETLDTNLTSGFLAAKHQLPAMLKDGGGSLIFVSTFVGHVLGIPGMAAYGAAKAGLIGLMRVIAAEYAARGIRVNALLPGGTDTPGGRQGAGSLDGLEFVKSMHAMKRIATPEEIAQSALYLASDMSSFMTGATLLVDGGVTISKM